jgi:predicted flap endonuclease-1-like 5' DNA nuclease
MEDLKKLQGISKAQIAKLHKAGVRGLGTLLVKGSTLEGRTELSQQTRIAANRIMNWVHRADLMRVIGIDDDYARVLARAGVTSIVDLSTRNPRQLASEVKVAAVIEDVERVPRHASLKKWIEEARHRVRHVWYHDTLGDPELTGIPTTQWPGPVV